ncbi:glycerophosphodiester phosphodiesterase [bacterium AH-315-P15]|nr:glycerophosphodiester phosphodiesterase [bacterium AH-315-P15]
MDWLRALPIAHRGLHDAAIGVVENSPSAFEAAARAGYGIELDVVISADGEAIVFHDKDLNRVTKETGLVRTHRAAELTQILLEGSADTIPRLADVFDLVRGRVPLLIEIKNANRQVGELEARVAKLLSTYQGPAAVQSFNPYSMAWFASNASDVVRGQLSQDFRYYDEKPMPDFQRFLLRHMLLNVVSRPHFVAYDCEALPAIGPGAARKLGLPLLCWTVKSLEMQAQIRPYADNIIFEGFRPPLGAPETANA